MAVTLTAADVAAQIRVGDSQEELLLIGTRFAYASAEVLRIAPDAPDATHNMAVVSIVGYLFDAPMAAAGDNYANAVRFSGAGRQLFPWRVHRLGISDSTTPSNGTSRSDTVPQTMVKNGGPMPTSLPSVRFYRVELEIGVSGFPQVSGWTAQEWIDNAAAEVPGATKRAVSVAAPVHCNQVAFHYSQGNTQYEWAAVAVADGDDLPTHYRLANTVQPDNWPQRWAQASGQGVIEGTAHDVYFWPVVVTAFPATLTFEWPI